MCLPLPGFSFVRIGKIPPMLDYSPAFVLLFQIDYLEMRIEYA